MSGSMEPYAAKSWMQSGSQQHDRFRCSSEPGSSSTTKCDRTRRPACALRYQRRSGESVKTWPNRKGLCNCTEFSMEGDFRANLHWRYNITVQSDRSARV